MPRRNDIKKILIIGSGPIVIGQACEFDYSGTQGCRALKEEGYKIILVNSNPATIMTDPEFSDKTYIEPLTKEFLEEIIRKERPDALLPTLGGQTALNLSVELYEKGILKKYGVELIGARYEAIKKAEDRFLFKKTMIEAGLEVPKSGYAKSVKEALKIVKKVGYPNIIRPSFTLGGVGGSICYKESEFKEKVKWGLAASPVNKILIEESLIGWKEYELEVMRDKNDNVVIVCPIENFDPMGIHTGDSITVAPAQTLTDKEYQKLRDASITIMRSIGVDTGGSNVQFAVNPDTGRLVVIEMNPRVSRSSALASKATGFPIAKIAAKLAVGYTLDEIKNDITKKTPASFEPAIDYVVVKIPRFTFEKFLEADQTLNTAMKSVGEVMAIGRNFKEALQKAIRGLEIGRYGMNADGLGQVQIVDKLSNYSDKSIEKINYIEQVTDKLKVPNCDRIFNIGYALQLGFSVDKISKLSKIDKWFIYQIKEIVDLGEEIGLEENLSPFLLRKAKEYGFSDRQIGYLTDRSEYEIKKLRLKFKITPKYKLIDTCAGEFEASTPYFYSTYESENDDIGEKKQEVRSKKKKKIMILGGGPNRIGQGIEFDYCCVHSVFALRELGFETIMVNCNPETVSTDYDISDKLYFEPLTFEDVMNIVEREKPEGVIIQFGGQTPLNLALRLKEAGVNIIGTSPDNIDLAEDRVKFGKLLKRLNIPVPLWGCANNLKEAIKIVEKIGYPVLIRPSYVLGGRAMEVAYDNQSLEKYVKIATDVSPEHPIFIDKFLQNAIEVDVDAVCDGKDTFIGGILEHIEQAGIHSGDSACAIPPRTLKPKIINTIIDYTKKSAKALNVKGLLNIQFAIKDGKVFILEVNPRASRTVPFVSKATGVSLVKLAVSAIINKKLSIYHNKLKKMDYFAIKESVLPFNRFIGTDTVLGPEMRSTGEVMGIDFLYEIAFAKSQIAAGTPLPKEGTVFVSVRRNEKEKILHVAKGFEELGFDIVATTGTAEYLESKNIKVKYVKKVSEGSPNIVNYIKGGKMSLIIDIPSGKKMAVSDGRIIRTTAISYNVPIITTIAAATVSLEAIKSLRHKKPHIKPIQQYWR
ncbi:MAG: carbamoyl-phosphate synthase large subunit [Elusimicrobia bacterium]|nr:carbamoyl-phosphate synthase large subunit [Elusimicrobiota bacterium]